MFFFLRKSNQELSQVGGNGFRRTQFLPQSFNPIKITSMKKYITIAALLAAGSAFANAETFTWNSTEGDFSGFRTVGGELVTITGDFTLEFVVQASTRDARFEAVLSGAEGVEFGLVNFHGNSSYELDWVKKERGLDERSESKSLGGHFSDVRIVNSPATFTFAFTETSSGYYDLLISASNQEANNWTANWTVDGLNLGRVDNQQTSITWTSLIQSETATVSSMTLTTAIPEPSAFGMLAGLGALALVASRRRRR